MCLLTVLILNYSVHQSMSQGAAVWLRGDVLYSNSATLSNQRKVREGGSTPSFAFSAPRLHLFQLCETVAKEAKITVLQFLFTSLVIF